MEQLQEFFTSEQFLWSVGIIIAGIIVYLVLIRILDKMLQRKAKHIRVERRRQTYIKMARSVIRWIIVLIIILTLLQVNGININSILASLGIGAIIAGLALQDALKDIIMGFNLIVDDYFAVGDVIEYAKKRGVVLELGLKVTKVRCLADNGILTIANRNISAVFVVSRQLDIDLPIANEHKASEVEAVIVNALPKITKIPEINSAEYKGLEKFKDSSAFYKIRLMAKPELQGQVKRDVNRILKHELDKHNIMITCPDSSSKSTD